ncbi:MAG TPA: glycosyl hydrolase family 35 [Lentisphaeria bacterium]|nr:MAG: hypothetical protein A2X48_21860 [Lentisphaerae bacterium GWF2_49_21]HBC87727.1 glycosyl hydrolase family 35 [Lentisphaeria bacterium]
MNIQSITLPKRKNISLAKKIFSGRSRNGGTIAMNSLYLEFNGRPWLPSMGEFQYSRYPADLWEDEIRKIKAGGVDIVPTYAFWIHHEEEEGVFDWTGRRNVRRFVELCKKHGLWVIMRMGPFCHGEARNGGMPDWLFGRSFEVRRNDPKYLFYVKRLYNQIGKQLKGLTFKDGGPIIGIQCENEFMSSAAPWETTHNTGMLYTPVGSDGISHMKVLKKSAISAGMDVPLHASTGWGGSPIDIKEFLPMFGGYGYYAWLDDPSSQGPSGFFLFQDMRNRKAEYRTDSVPFACCEIGGGMQPFYKNRPVVPPESVEAMHVVQLGSGSNMMGYYVYHGGSNPIGNHSFFNEHRCPRISYDFQAPLSEFGRRRPHYGMLRRQFIFLKEFGEILAPMQTSIPGKLKSMKAEDTRTPRWSVRAKDDSGFLFLNNFQDHAEMCDLKNLVFKVNTGKEILIFPPGGNGLTLKKGKCAILPFNLDLGGLLLKSATVQPLAKIDLKGTPHYFFFAPEGFPAELAINFAIFSGLKIYHGKRNDIGGTAIITCHAGTDNLLDFTLKDGRRVLVTVLTDEQSRNFWKAEFAGQERVFISENGLLFSKKKIEIYDVATEEMDFSVYPPLDRKLAGWEIKRDGIFQRQVISVPRRFVNLKIKKISEGKVSLKFPNDAFKGSEDLYLQINYIGDTGSAYLDGKLIHDNFWNGKTWEIGLRRFATDLLKSELVIIITPLRKNSSKVEYTSMAAMKDAGGEGERLRFLSIKVVACQRKAVIINQI